MFDENFKYNGAILIEPPKKLQKSIYICDNVFHLDNILEMYKQENNFGIILIDGNNLLCYKIIKSGAHVEIISLYNKYVNHQKRQKKGGQSAQRIGRLRNQKENAFIQHTAEITKKLYMNNTNYLINGLVIAGPAEMKDKIKNNNLFSQYFKNKIIKIITTQNITDNSVLEVYNECIEDFVTDEDKEAIGILQKAKEIMLNNDDKLIYNYKKTIKFMTNCMLEYLLIDINLDKNQKENLYNLNTYGCKIYELYGLNLEGMQLECLGIKWY